ncbi:MAG TPA: hypothetical protein VN524_03675, partial [Hyphomicrobiaceae bacterium]|nr:hypothetical protein [Hyphomicrobiaceae bacterium]
MSTDIQDTGEKLGGAVKDDWANYQRKQEEEAAKTSVAALWPKPDWKALIAEIAENPEHTAETARQLAATLYVVRDLAIDHQQRSGAFTRGPVRYKDETIPALKVRFLSELQSHLLSCFFDPELGSITGAVLSFAHYLAEGGIPYEDRIDEDIRDPAEAYPKALAILKVAMRDPYVPMARGYRHPPYKPGREQLQQRVMEWSATLTAMVRNLLHDGWPDVMPTRGRGRRQLPPMPQRPRLERLERTGPEHRTGDVRPEAIIETLGIRGVEFGNWVDGGERQANVNLAFDALHDLVEVLGIKPADIGRGRLGIGFGSRGRGSSGGMAIAAHYEPSRVVINLTRFAGDGSLAHEMGHMFEHGLAGFEFIPEDGPT